MKRTRLRQRSLKNSRPYENLRLRAQVVSDHPQCEYWVWFPQHFPKAKSDDPHHLFGGRSGKYDWEWNIIATGRIAHDWNERFKTDGRILGLWIRHMTSGIDLSQFPIASGYHSLAGWLEIVEVSNKWVQPYLDQLKVAYPYVAA